MYMAKVDIPDWLYAKIINLTYEETPNEFVTRATRHLLNVTETTKKEIGGKH